MDLDHSDKEFSLVLSLTNDGGNHKWKWKMGWEGQYIQFRKTMKNSFQEFRGIFIQVGSIHVLVSQLFV